MVDEGFFYDGIITTGWGEERVRRKKMKDTGYKSRKHHSSSN